MAPRHQQGPVTDAIALVVVGAFDVSADGLTPSFPSGIGGAAISELGTGTVVQTDDA